MMRACVVALLIAGVWATGCKDGNGEEVDWFVVVKFPRSDTHAVFYPTLQDFSISEVGLSSGGPIVETLNQIYEGDASYVMYNDECPNCTRSATYGHAKGVAGWASSGGFYLVHSVPQFPPKKSDGFSPRSALRNGHSFLCITLSRTELEKVGRQWHYIRPHLYDSHNIDLPSISAYASGAHVPNSFGNNHNIIPLTSLGGRSFDYFAKTASWGKDIFGLIAQTYDSPLVAVTSRNGSRSLPVECSAKNRVTDADEVVVAGRQWVGSVDQSKWCVTTQPARRRACVGDIDRTVAQLSRGGGMLCFQGAIHDALSRGIVSGSRCAETTGYNANSEPSHKTNPDRNSNPSASQVSIIILGAIGVSLLFAGLVLFTLRRCCPREDHLDSGRRRAAEPSVMGI